MPYAVSIPQQASNQQTLQRKRTRNVRFDDEANKTRTIDSRSTLTCQERSDLWYTKDEMNGIRRRVRNQCRLMLMGINISNLNEDFRGLEQCTSFSRNKNKAAATKLILQAHQHGLKPDQIAAIAQHYGATAQVTALMAAHDDFLQSYCCDPAVTPDATALTATPRKRQLQQSQPLAGSSRRVRRHVEEPIAVC